MKNLIKFIIAKITILVSFFCKGNKLGSIYYHDVVLVEGESFNKINLENK